MHARAGPLLARSMRACPSAPCAASRSLDCGVGRARGAAPAALASSSWGAAGVAAPAPAARGGGGRSASTLLAARSSSSVSSSSSRAEQRKVVAAAAAAAAGGGGGGAGPFAAASAGAAAAAAAGAGAAAAAAAAAAAGEPATKSPQDSTASTTADMNHHHNNRLRGPPSDDDYSSSSSTDGESMEEGDADNDDPPPSTNPRVEYLGAVDGGAMLTVRGRLTLPLDRADAVYAVLRDYDRCPEVFSSTVLHARSERSGPTEPGGEETVSVVQGAKWRVLGFSGSFDVRLSVREDPQARTLVFRLVESAFLRGFEGRWAVAPTKSGRGCVVEHVLAVEPVVPLPRPIAAVASVLFTRQIDSLLGDLRAEMERQRWGSRGGGGGGSK